MGREKQDIEKTYEEKIHNLVSEIDAQNDVNKEIKTQLSAHELTIQKMEVVNKAETENCQRLKTQLSTHELIIQKLKTANKTVTESCQQLKECLSDKERIIVELTTQIETHQCDIGNYLVRNLI